MSYSQTADASKPQKKMQECNRCKAAGFPNQPIGFEKIGEDPATGKIKWKLIDENGNEHQHKGQSASSGGNWSRRKRVVDVVTLTDLQEVRRLLALSWDYEDSYPATVAAVPHYVLVKRE